MTTTDTMGAALIRHGFVANDYLLSINGGLSVPRHIDLPPPWNLPSRMFQFPIEVGRDEDETHIGLLHPSLADHPFVSHLESVLGITLDPEGAPNSHGYSKRETAQWWHAVDLAPGRFVTYGYGGIEHKGRPWYGARVVRGRGATHAGVGDGQFLHQSGANAGGDNAQFSDRSLVVCDTDKFAFAKNTTVGQYQAAGSLSHQA